MAVFKDEEAIQAVEGSSAEKLATDESEILVDWDGPDDPQNPLNWHLSRKAVCLFIISLFTFCSPLSATYPAGVSPQLATRYNITSEVMLALLTSSFCKLSTFFGLPAVNHDKAHTRYHHYTVIAFALGPLRGCSSKSHRPSIMKTAC